ncbi:rhodanese-like domain-containing protein [Tellurirhabdus rosea]|uniref:rhodanese-like domain-containing protein n=1 Tax=Tellurirhabdus rosea TaxID=2674997 RepID=UPI002254FF98|nr:rhodanese-like domain-containing protein [Tellurirhabdus rosea]
MLSFIKTIFGGSEDATLQEVLAKDSVIIDVRTPAEFSGGHAPRAINIPLDELPRKIAFIRAQQKPVVVCCASGMRSARAKSLLAQNGITDVHDAGSWRKL